MSPSREQLVRLINIIHHLQQFPNWTDHSPSINNNLGISINLQRSTMKTLVRFRDQFGISVKMFYISIDSEVFDKPLFDTLVRFIDYDCEQSKIELQLKGLI